MLDKRLWLKLGQGIDSEEAAYPITLSKSSLLSAHPLHQTRTPTTWLHQGYGIKSEIDTSVGSLLCNGSTGSLPIQLPWSHLWQQKSQTAHKEHHTYCGTTFLIQKPTSWDPLVVSAEGRIAANMSRKAFPLLNRKWGTKGVVPEERKGLLNATLQPCKHKFSPAAASLGGQPHHCPTCKVQERQGRSD